MGEVHDEHVKHLIQINEELDRNRPKTLIGIPIKMVEEFHGYLFWTSEIFYY